MTNDRPAVRFLMMMLTSRCNLHCRYCYVRANGQGQHMSWEVARQAVDTFAAHEQPVVIELTGGEPLLNFSLVEKLVSYAAAVNPKARFSIQTNGTLLDEEKLVSLIDLGIGIALSLDGTPVINDQLRGGSKAIVRNLKLLEAYRAGVNLTAVLTNQNIEHIPRFLLFCSSFACVRVINLDILRPFAGSQAEPPEKAQLSQLAHQLPETLAFINRRRAPPLKVREVEQIRQRQHETTGCAYCHASLGQAAAVTPGGDVYACASLVGVPGYQAGTVWEPDSQGLMALSTPDLYPAECMVCEINHICRGGCPTRRVAYYGGPLYPSELECHWRKELYWRLKASSATLP